MSAEARLKELGIELPPPMTGGYLNMAVKIGNVIFTSGHTSDITGKCGRDIDAAKGAEAAREAILKVLSTVRNNAGSLDNIRVVRLLGCVNSADDFIDQPKVMNGASDVLHQIFGKDDLGYHARSALGFAQLPGGAAVEIEGIFSVEA
jgi:enamine deaminase RidA (YjgF/YER057c/UK114 family)